ncbi:MAG: 3-deoxy-manno-octulosonate cytidylyltransferase [Chromatiales bacterium]|nr:3-deoxy-manno-octulosonate cytidylyltransferase [Chromatiales bacterium]
MDFRVVIPARFASSRLPGKALLPLAGRPMIEHVWRQATRSHAREVIIATDDDRVRDAAQAFGAGVVMTASTHRSGTERIAEVATLRGWPDDQIVVNCQGDAPLAPPENIDQVAGLLAADRAAGMATLCVPILDDEDYESPHVVKVVADRDGRALYFSRAPIPARGHDGSMPAQAFRHLGLYAYRAGTLRELAASAACALELSEQLEQLRALWLGIGISIATANVVPGPDVDTPDDLARVAALLKPR